MDRVCLQIARDNGRNGSTLYSAPLFIALHLTTTAEEAVVESTQSSVSGLILSSLQIQFTCLFHIHFLLLTEETQNQHKRVTANLFNTLCNVVKNFGGGVSGEQKSVDVRGRWKMSLACVVCLTGPGTCNL